MLSGLGWGQCACLFYDTNDEITCVLLGNCAAGGVSDCASYTTSTTLSACPCPQTSSMNAGCGGCQANNACWYNGTKCNPDNVCDLLTEIVTLPISLVSYTGFVNDLNHNELNWVTDTEINNDYYIVSHSDDGENFRELYRLPGSGNSTQTLSYRFIHNDPKPEINYYKLIQVDYDGQSETFGPISIDNRDQKRTLIKVVNMMGQEVNENYSGIVIYIYDDGTKEKIYQ